MVFYNHHGWVRGREGNKASLTRKTGHRLSRISDEQGPNSLLCCGLLGARKRWLIYGFLPLPVPALTSAQDRELLSLVRAGAAQSAGCSSHKPSPVPVYLTGHGELGPNVQHVQVNSWYPVDLCPDPVTFSWTPFAICWSLVPPLLKSSWLLCVRTQTITIDVLLQEEATATV